MRVLGALLLVLAINAAAWAGNVAPSGGGGLNGVLVTNAPSGSGLCLASTSTTQAAWGSCGSGNLPALGSAGSFLLQNAAGNAAVWTLLTGDVSYSVATPGAGTVIAIRGKTVKNQAPTDAQIYIWNNTNADWEPLTLSQDLSITNAGVVTVTKTANVAFAASATTDTTNATNISSGTLAAARGGAGATTGILKANGAGLVSAAVSATDYAPATSGSSILKASAGGFANAVSGTDYAPATSGSAILKGNGAGGFANAASGTDYAPATSGSSVLLGNGAGGFSLLAGNSLAANNFATSISAAGVISGAQPAFTNISGSLASTQMPALTGDTTTSAGSTVTTTGKVNGVTYGASPSTNTVPVVTGANATTYETAPAGAGGTGVSSPAAHAIPFAEGASAFNFLTLTAFQVLGMGTGGTDPLGYTIPNCGDATHALAFSQSTPGFSCQAITATATAGGNPGSAQWNNAGAIAGFGGTGTTGILKLNGASSPSVAVAGTDYQAAIAGNTLGANLFATQITAAGALVGTQPNFTNLAGNIATSQMNSGTGASASTFWRGDGTWVAPGNVVASAQFDIPYYSSAGSAQILTGAAISGLVKASTSGAPVAAVAKTDYAPATTGGANAPLLNDGVGGFTNGSRIGNTTQFVSYAGSQAGNGHLASFDANGNLQDGGVGSNYATIVNTSGTSITATCSAVGGGHASRDMVWQLLTGALTYTTPTSATGCSDGDIIEGYFIQGTNQAYQVTLADGAGTNHIGTLFSVPTSSGQTNYFLHFALEYHSSLNQWEVLEPQMTNPLSIQGTGTKYQRSTGTTTNGHCTQFDATGNTVDSGSACATSAFNAAGVTQVALTWDSGL